MYHIDLHNGFIYKRKLSWCFFNVSKELFTGDRIKSQIEF